MHDPGADLAGDQKELIQAGVLWWPHAGGMASATGAEAGQLDELVTTQSL